MTRSSLLLLALLLTCARAAAGGQETPPDQSQANPQDQHAGHVPQPLPGEGWAGTWDAVVFGTFNNQGGHRGENEFRSQNWFMGTASRRLGPGTLGVTGMLALEPLTAPGLGFSEVFQVGEAYQGLQITDHQHPHDLFMQLSSSWTVPIGSRTNGTVAGALVGEPALGPIPFMHRASSAENPMAPLAHHIFDSTHMASSVILGRVDRGMFSVEGSVFHGREPDEHHYDLEFGALDSWSARVWFRPTPGWLIQASHGFLEEPEALEPGDQRRTNMSASWSRRRDSGFTAITAAVGRNRRPYSTLDSFLIEGTHKAGKSSFYTRFENTEVETEILLFPQIVHVPHPGELVDTVRALTLGSVRDVMTFSPLVIGVGGGVTFFGVPVLLENTHGAHPVSFQLFVRIARSDLTRRMWDMTMAQHAGGHRH